MPSSTLFSCFLIYKNKNQSSSSKVLWFDEFTTKLIRIIVSTLVCSTLFTEVFQFGIYLDIHVTKHFTLGSSVRPSVKPDGSPTGKHLCSVMIQISRSQTCLRFNIFRKSYWKYILLSPTQRNCDSVVYSGVQATYSCQALLKAFLIYRQIQQSAPSSVANA